jgi:hypothetical protein
MSKKLIGKKVIIVGNDFQTEDTVGMIIIIDEVKKKLLLQLDKIVLDSNKTYQYVVATSKLKSQTINTLFSESLACGVIWISDERFNPKDPLDISWWRGGAADTTDLRLLNV